MTPCLTPRARRRYYNDLYELDLEELKWSSLGPRPGALAPSPRSGCQLALHPEAATLFLYGGYRKEPAAAGEPEAVEQGAVMSDMWALDLERYEWGRVRREGLAPGPRAGFSLAVLRGRALLFGGVADSEAKGGTVLISEFFNELYAFSLDSRRWFPLPLAAPPRAAAPPAAPAPAPAAAATPAAAPAASSALHRAATRIQAHFRGYAVRKLLRVYRIGGAVGEMLYAPALGFAPPSAAAPYGRIGGALCAAGGALWLFGGLVEVGDAEIAFDDVWRLSLGAKGGPGSWECLQPPSVSREELRRIAEAGGAASEDEGWEEGEESE